MAVTFNILEKKKQIDEGVSRTMNINRYLRTPLLYTVDKINEKNIALPMINHNIMTSLMSQYVQE